MTSKTLKDLMKEKDAIDREMRTRGEKLVKEEIERFFTDNPKLQGIVWQQYAPSFNDGDPCYFSVHDFYATCGGDDVDMDEVSEYEGWSDSDGKDQRRLADELSSLINDEDLLKCAFGEHALVTITRKGKGIQVEIGEPSGD